MIIIIIIIYHTIILSSSSYIVICLRCLSCIFFVIMVKNGSRLSLPPLPPPTLLQLDGMVSGPPYFSRDYYQLYSPSFLPLPLFSYKQFCLHPYIYCSIMFYCFFIEFFNSASVSIIIMIMIKVMGSFFRKLIFVANTCAIITQIDIHLFIHSFIHSFIVVVVVKFFIREWPHLFTFFKFFNHKNRRKKKKGLTMERKTLFFFSFIV